MIWVVISWPVQSCSVSLIGSVDSCAVAENAPANIAIAETARLAASDLVLNSNAFMSSSLSPFCGTRDDRNLQAFAGRPLPTPWSMLKLTRE